MTTTTTQLMRRYDREYADAVSHGNTERAVELNHAREASMEALARFLGITDYDATATAPTVTDLTGSGTTFLDPRNAGRVRATAGVWEDINVDPSQLAPDMLIAYAQSEAGTIDAAISEIVGAMHDTSQKAAILHAVSDYVNSWAAGHTNPDESLHVDGAGGADLIDVPMGDGSTRQMSLRDAMRLIGQALPSGTPATWRRGDLDGLRNSLQQAGQALNEGSEQRSLRLQTLTNRRNQLFQLTTQLLMTMSEANKGIVGNIGR